MSSTRQLAAIMFTDIVGYTALMGEDEDKAFELLRKNRQLQKPVIEQYGGRWIKELGDGILASFNTVSDAVIAAIKIQEACYTVNEFQLRIGIHQGEVVFESDDIFGDAVNIASRIQTLGTPGSILFSKKVANEIKNKAGFHTVSLGFFDFKNVGEPVEVFALANEGLLVPKREQIRGKLKNAGKKFSLKKIMLAIGIVALLMMALLAGQQFFGKKEYAKKDKTIAVLPFKNISVNKEENEPFCVGVVLELQKNLEWINGLIPISSLSVEKFRDTKISIANIARELGGVKYIVEGTVLRDKNKIKVFVSLVDAVSGEQLWSEDYPGEVEDIFSLQENIAQQIASALQVKVTPDEQSRISHVATKSVAAIDAYNEALTSYMKLATAVHPLYWDSLPSNQSLYSQYLKTLLLCDNAINTDPSMADAYVLKGRTYLYSIFDWSASKTWKNRVLDSVKLLGRKALQLDKSLADAYLLISKCFHFRDSALLYVKKALAINPNSFEANWWWGGYNAWSDPEKAIPFFKKAIRLNPLSVWTPLVYRDLGLTYHGFGDFEKAVLYGKKSVELSNNSIIAIEAQHALAIIYLHWEKGDSAIKYANQYANQNISKEINALYEIAEAFCNLKNDCAQAAELYKRLWSRYHNRSNPHRWAVALMNIGKSQEAKEKIKQAFTEYKERNDTLSYDYAGICALNGDKEKAMRILRKCDWDWGLPYLIKHDKLFDNIRHEKEFRQIVQKALDEKAKIRERIHKLEQKGEL